MIDIKSETAKRVFWGIVVVLVLLNLVGIVWNFLPGKPKDWQDNTFAGKVVSFDGVVLVTQDPRGNTTSFELSSTTKILSGRDVVTASAVVVDKLVLITTISATSTRAIDVRLMSGKPKDHKERF